MAIPMSALRRALAEMAGDAGRGIRNAYSGDHVMGGMTLGALGGGVSGGVADEMTPGENTAYWPAGMAAGAALGAAGGGGAKLAHMVINAAREGGRGFSVGLREALAEQAASRGMGRRAVREMADAEDAAAFSNRSSGERGLLQRAGDYISENPTEFALAGAATSMGALGGGGLLALTGGMAAQYQRAQRATGIEDLSMMTPEELAVLGHPQLERDPELQAEAQQILMQHLKEAR